ncbi:MAG: thioesterase family protein [Solirubrobacterales bacterium]
MASPEGGAIDPRASVPGPGNGDFERREPGQLSPGIERTIEFEVADRLITDVGGTIGVRVLSTPGMIAMMERTAAMLSFERLPEGRATVGFEVCVKHVAAATEGSDCTATARLREVADERKLRFDVEVKEGDRTIGVGTHERRVIDVGAVKSE